MAEQQALDATSVGGAENQDENKKNRSFYRYLLIVLRYILFLVILSIFIITITILTVRSLQDQYSITNNASSFVMDIEQNIPEELAWFQQLGEVRGNLRDSIVKKVFIADIYLGFSLEDQFVQQELQRKSVQIKERVNLYFTSRYSSDLEGNRNFIKMKIELRELINRILNNKIREVAFNDFQIVSF